MNVGYIGLGNMGGPLARRLQLRQKLFVYDLSEAAVRRLKDVGATQCSSVQDISKRCDVILLCLPTSEHVRTLLFGNGGIAETAAAGTLIIDQTTGDPLLTRAFAADLAKRGLDFIDAPVSGGPRGADSGTIAIMVGGSEAQFNRAEPVLRMISSNVFHTGGVGTGHVMKLANNMLAAGHRAIGLEAVCLAVKNGIDPTTAVDIMLKSSGKNHFMEYSMKHHVVTGKLAQGFTLGLAHKDVRLATQLGIDSGVPLYFGNMVREFYQTCINEMGEDSEVNTAALVADRIAKTNVVPPGYSTT